MIIGYPSRENGFIIHLAQELLKIAKKELLLSKDW